MTPLNLAELGLIAEHLWLRADLDRYDENSPTQLFVHCPFDKPHAVSDALLKVDCSRAVVVVSCAPCKFEIEYSCTEVGQGLREASVDYVTSGRAAYVGVADLLEGAERPRSRSAPLYLVGVDDLHISESMLRELYAVPYTVVMSEDDLHQRAAVIRGVLDISECLAGTVRQLMDFQRRFQPVWGALFDRWVRERGVSGGAWSEWAVFRRRGKMEFVRRGRGVNGSVTRRGRGGNARLARKMLTLPNEYALGERVAKEESGESGDEEESGESGGEEESGESGDEEKSGESGVGEE